MGRGVQKYPATKIAWTRCGVFSSVLGRFEARVAELADAADSKSAFARIVGSTPTPGTNRSGRADARDEKGRRRAWVVLPGSRPWRRAEFDRVARGTARDNRSDSRRESGKRRWARRVCGRRQTAARLYPPDTRSRLSVRGSWSFFPRQFAPGTSEESLLAGRTDRVRIEPGSKIDGGAQIARGHAPSAKAVAGPILGGIGF